MAHQNFDPVSRRRRTPIGNRFEVNGVVTGVNTGDSVFLGLRYVLTAQVNPEGAVTGAISVQRNQDGVTAANGWVTINHGIGGAVNFSIQATGR